MITDSAISALDWLFENAVRENSTLGPEDCCVITSQAATVSAARPQSTKLVVLNISSYLFRIAVFVEFDTAPASIAHLAKILRSPEEKLEGQVLHDIFAEFVNLICGAVNRKLCTEFRHVGLSTPFFLDSSCASYIAMLNPAVIKSFDVSVNELTNFKLTWCLCGAKGCDINFNFDRANQQQEAVGELEFF